MQTAPGPALSPWSALFLPGVAVASLAGFALGWRGASPRSDATASSLPATAAASVASAAPAPTAAPLGHFDEEVASPGTDHERRLRLARAAALLGRAELVDALERERVRQSKAANSDDELPGEALLARLAEIDPAAAAAWVARLQQEAGITHPAWLEVTLGPWLDRDPEAALAWGAALPHDGFRSSVDGELLKRLAGRDPRRAVALLRTPEWSDDSAANLVFGELAKTDLPFACEQALRAPPELVRSAVTGVLSAWAQRGDFSGAYAWADALPSSAVRTTALPQLYRDWGDRDPAAAGAWMLAHGGSDLAASADGLAEKWAHRDLTAALAWCGRLPLAVRRDALDSAVQGWASDDPRAAAQYAATLPDAADRNVLTSTVSEWAQADRETALAWAEGLPPGKARAVAQQAVCRTWAEENPRACLDYLNGLADKTVLKETQDSVFQQWANTDPDGLWDFARNCADARQGNAAAVAVVDQLASTDPARAGSLLTQLPAGVQKKEAGQLVRRWANADEAAAGQWATTLPEGEMRTEVWTNLISQWQNDDAPSAAAWISAQPAGESRDQGIMTLLQFSGGDDALDGKTAMRLARSVGSAETRVNALDDALRTWLGQDRAAATAYLQRAKGLTNDERATLQATVDRFGKPLD